MGKKRSDFSHTFFLFGPSIFFVKVRELRTLEMVGRTLALERPEKKKHIAMREDVVVAEKLWIILILFRKRLTDRLFLLLPVIFWILPEFFAHSHSTDLLKVKKTKQKNKSMSHTIHQKKTISFRYGVHLFIHFLVKGVGMTHTNLLPLAPVAA